MKEYYPPLKEFVEYLKHELELLIKVQKEINDNR